LAQRHSRKGNQSFWSSDFSKRHTSNYRLTSKGREHAKIAGDWIKKVKSTEKKKKISRYFIIFMFVFFFVYVCVFFLEYF